MANTIVLIFILLCFNTVNLSHAENESTKLEGIVKTIHTESDVINCVDIYRQPAFDHPLLKDHKIEMTPSQNIKLQPNISEVSVFYQTWHESGECPKGTVPIRRSEEIDEEIIMKMKRRSIRNSNVSNANDPFVHEYVTMAVYDDTYYGTRFATTVWNPYVEHNEISTAQTWITAGPPNTEYNSIGVGWMVHPILYGDFNTRLFIMWTTDGYETVCYDLKCPGFVQVSRTVVPGYALTPVSRYGIANIDLSISVYKVGDKWWLQVDKENVGYWPTEIFPLLSNYANRVRWGGEVAIVKNTRHNSHTEMGSGHFASKKYLKAALFHNLQVITKEDNPNFHNPTSFYPEIIAGNNRYSLSEGKDYRYHFGDHFFYGGPGYSALCKSSRNTEC